MQNRKEINPLILAELDACGLSWEVREAKNRQLWVSGQFVGVLPRGKVTSAEKRSALNVRAQIRRLCKQPFRP